MLKNAKQKLNENWSSHLHWFDKSVIHPGGQWSAPITLNFNVGPHQSGSQCSASCSIEGQYSAPQNSGSRCSCQLAVSPLYSCKCSAPFKWVVTQHQRHGIFVSPLSVCYCQPPYSTCVLGMPLLYRDIFMLLITHTASWDS